MLATRQDRLSECEAVIERAKNAFHEAGRVLLEIKDEEYWKDDGYSSFEDYCELKWNFKKSQAYRLIDGFLLRQEIQISPMGENLPLPETERQTRAMAKLLHEGKKDLIPFVWEKAVEKANQDNRKMPTGNEVLSVVREYCEPCVVDPMEFRRVTYLNKKYDDLFESLSRGEDEARFLRAIVEHYCDNAPLFEGKLRFR